MGRRCKQKVAYPSARTAADALLKTRIRAALRGEPEREKRLYRCQECKWWHLTSQKEWRSSGLDRHFGQVGVQ